ncbi:hypothetical protein D3C71_2034740 [compost metagenome]
MVVDHGVDHFAQDGFGQGGRHARLFGQPANAFDLLGLALGIHQVHSVVRLQFADHVRATEPHAQQQHDLLVDFIDLGAQRR